jgi:hypothetical protein
LQSSIVFGHESRDVVGGRSGPTGRAGRLVPGDPSIASTASPAATVARMITAISRRDGHKLRAILPTTPGLSLLAATRKRRSRASSSRLAPSGPWNRDRRNARRDVVAGRSWLRGLWRWALSAVLCWLRSGSTRVRRPKSKWAGRDGGTGSRRALAGGEVPSVGKVDFGAEGTSRGFRRRSRPDQQSRSLGSGLEDTPVTRWSSDFERDCRPFPHASSCVSWRLSSNERSEHTAVRSEPRSGGGWLDAKSRQTPLPPTRRAQTLGHSVSAGWFASLGTASHRLTPALPTKPTPTARWRPLAADRVVAGASSG